MVTKSKSPITAESIYSELINKKISKVTAIDFLISLIEGSNNDEIRIKSIEILSKISLKNNKVFKILENILISDENPSIRAIAAKIMINNFADRGYSSLNWTIQHENSCLVFKTLLDSINRIKSSNLKILNKMIEERLATIYGVVPDEALFLLDLEIEVNFFNIDYLKIYSTNTVYGVINSNYMMCAIKNGHITALNLSNWGLSSLPNSIGNLNKLKYLILKNNNLKTIPESISSLHRLRTLNLSGCKIVNLPNAITNLKKIKNLSLCQNFNLNLIPQSIITMAKKYLSMKYIREGVNPSEAFILALMEILSGSKLKKIKADELIIYKDEACNYKINENGHVIGIYIFNSHLSNLTTFPNQVCSLEYLEELELPNNDIKIIPDSIGNLNNLQRLNLRNNMIEIVPESLNKLKNLNFLKLSGNRIKIIPKWINKKLDKFESSEDLNGFKKYFFGIPISEIIRKYK